MYGCFQATVAELGSCDNDLYGLQSEKYLLSGPLQKKLPASDLDYVTAFNFLFLSSRARLAIIRLAYHNTEMIKIILYPLFCYL